MDNRETVKNYRAITISGEIASGKSSLAKVLESILPGWERINTGQRFRDYCEAHGLSIQQVSFLPDEVHREFDADQRELIRTGQNIIVEGRLSGWLARGFDDVFRIFCYAPAEVRAERYMRRDHVEQPKAIEDIEYREKLDVEKYQRIYQLEDYRSASFYHLLLNTGVEAPHTLAASVIRAAGLIDISASDSEPVSS